MYDLLHEAERSVRRDGITDLNYLTRIVLPTIVEEDDDSVDGASTTLAAAEALTAASKVRAKKHTMVVNVSTFSAGFLNTSDIRVDYRMAPDRVFLHDVYGNLSYIFGNQKTADVYALSSVSAQSIVERAKKLRLSLADEMTLNSASTLRGNTLQRVVRLGKDYLRILKLFYAINAVSVAKPDDLSAMDVLKSKKNSSMKPEALLTSAMALSRIIPISVISDAIHVNSMLTGQVVVNGDLTDDIIDYAEAVRLIFT